MVGISGHSSIIRNVVMPLRLVRLVKAVDEVFDAVAAAGEYVYVVNDDASKMFVDTTKRRRNVDTAPVRCALVMLLLVSTGTVLYL